MRAGSRLGLAPFAPLPADSPVGSQQVNNVPKNKKVNNVPKTPRPTCRGGLGCRRGRVSGAALRVWEPVTSWGRSRQVLARPANGLRGIIEIGLRESHAWHPVCRSVPCCVWLARSRNLGGGEER